MKICVYEFGVVHECNQHFGTLENTQNKHSAHIKYWRIIMIHVMKEVAFADNQLFKFYKNSVFMAAFPHHFILLCVCVCRVFPVYL